MRNFLFLMMLSAFMFAAETPSVIKPALDSFEGDAAKAYVLYQQAVAKATDKAVKDMDAKLKAATKGGNLELANAIKKELEALTKGDTLATLETKWKAEANTDLLGVSTKNIVVIVSAKFGAGSTFVDVTNVIKSRFDKKTNSLSTKSDGFGVEDPVKDVRKSVVIEYTVNGTPKTLTVQDGESIKINAP